MILNPILYSVLDRTHAEKSRFLINQWSMAFGDLGDIWTVIEYLRLFGERFHLDEGSMLFTAPFSLQHLPLSLQPYLKCQTTWDLQLSAESGAAGWKPTELRLQGLCRARYSVPPSILCTYILIARVCTCKHTYAHLVTGIPVCNAQIWSLQGTYIQRGAESTWMGRINTGMLPKFCSAIPSVQLCSLGAGNCASGTQAVSKQLHRSQNFFSPHAVGERWCCSVVNPQGLIHLTAKLIHCAWSWEHRAGDHRGLQPRHSFKQWGFECVGSNGACTEGYTSPRCCLSSPQHPVSTITEEKNHM